MATDGGATAEEEGGAAQSACSAAADGSGAAPRASRAAADGSAAGPRASRAPAEGCPAAQSGRSAAAEGSGARSAGGSDPRQPSTAKPYALPKLSPQDLPIDYAGFLTVVFGVVGVMLRIYMAIIFCAQSLANMNNFENDLKQLSMAFILSLEITSRKKGKLGSNSGASKRSRSGSNQHESLSVEFPMSKDIPGVSEKCKGKRRKKVVDTNAAKNIFLQLDSSARCKKTSV